MTNPPQNRRKHVRIYRNFILSCYLKGKRDIVYEMSQVNNISQGGLNFSSTTPFAKGSVLIIDLRTPFSKDKVELEGIVIEHKEKIANLIYEIRVHFQGISPLAVDVLGKIERYAAEKS